MPSAILDGITTRYEVMGAGPPLLMYAPGGFDATVEKWQTQGIYPSLKLLDHLPRHYTCILFDRRECGQSGGRIERITWAHYAAQGKALLEHLNIDRTHIMGGCMGCSAATAFAVAHPHMTQSLVLYWPVGGAKYRLSSRQRFAQHIAFVTGQGLAEVVALVAKDGKPFGGDPRGGPWSSVIKRDPAFAEAYALQNLDTYKLLVAGMARSMFDRDTAPGAEPEDLLTLDIPALIVPGRDAAHATSAARYLEECLAHAEYFDAPVAAQTEASVAPLLLDFLARADAT